MPILESTNGIGARTENGPTTASLPDRPRHAERRRAVRERRPPAPESRTKTPPAPTPKPDVPQPQFRIVHAVQLSKDGLIYVCDRVNDRIQVFQKDGTF